VDTGHHRTGVAWDEDEGPALAALVNALPGLRFAGLLTHGGHAYHGPDVGETAGDALVRRASEERDRILDLAVRLRNEGLAGDRFEVSIGSTPTLSVFENAERERIRITEVRPGNYVFNDAIQLALGSATAADCALTVLATVISKHRDRDGSERVFIDGGKKVFTSDTGAGATGFGIVLYNAQTMTALPHVEFTDLSEEHGWLRVRGGSTLSVGDRVRIIPNHACVVVATQPQFHVVDGEEVVETLTVDAR
ncbi:MAG TPA: alanine racemase, partial [Rhodothermales bacterium]